MKNLLDNQITIVKNAVEHLEAFTSNLDNYEKRISELEKENEELKKSKSNPQEIINIFKEYFKEIVNEYDYYDVAGDLEGQIDIDVEHYGNNIELESSLS